MRVPGMDAARLRRDLGSSATLERFGEQLERTRAIGGAEALPTLVLGERVVRGFVAYDEWRAAALAAGAQPSGRSAAFDRAGAAPLRHARDG